MNKILAIYGILLLISCEKSEVNFFDLVEGQENIVGKQEYIDTPYITAGDRVYSIGFQNGSFPEIGWHIPGEMGGVWDHPIKLMDGFDGVIITRHDTLSLDQANEFVNYPFANEHHYAWKNNQLTARRFQFVPDGMEGMIVQFEITNHGTAAINLAFEFVGHVDLRPTWLGERTQMIDADDQLTYDELSYSWEGKDADNPWFVKFGGDEKPSHVQQTTTRYQGKGAAGKLHYEIELMSEQTRLLTFFIAGSYKDKRLADETFDNLKRRSPSLFQTKGNRYEEIRNSTKLTTPDKKLNETFRWLKYNADWFVRTVPEIGSGIAAGYPDYPWWFGCDSEYSLEGYLTIGRNDIVYNTIALLDTLSKATNSNGRIIHETSTNGAVFNPGNVNETPQFASLLWSVYKWTGDEAIIRRYFPQVEKGLAWLLEEKDLDGDMLPEGAGMMEIHGLESEMIDVVCYTQKAFHDASNMAYLLNKGQLGKKYAIIAAELGRKINEEFWSAEFSSYADFIGTDEEALRLVNEAIIRADTLDKPWAVSELQQTKKYIQLNPSPRPRPFVVHHNWVVNTPMATGIADREKAFLALETARKFTNPFGMFVTGIDRDESAGSDDSSFKGSKQFSYTGAVMTLPTGIAAVAENNYGNPDQALAYLLRMCRSFSFALPGSMYEVSPDYGMFSQAWNIYSFGVPIVSQFFGVQPNAEKREIIITPQMPTQWEAASVENIRVAETVISIKYRKHKNGFSIHVESSNPRWRITPVPRPDYQIEIKPNGNNDRTTDVDFVLQ